MYGRVSTETLNALLMLDSCAIANAIEILTSVCETKALAILAFAADFRGCRLVGYATTLRVRAYSPPSKGNSYLDRTDWWRHLEGVPVPHVMVIQDMDNHAGRGAFVGEVHTNILKALGCVGAVTDGAVRDLAAIEGLNFQLFSKRVSVSHAYVHVVEFGTPVEVAGFGSTR